MTAARVSSIHYGDSVVGGVFSPAGWGEGFVNKATFDTGSFSVATMGVQGMGSGVSRQMAVAQLPRIGSFVDCVGVQLLSANDADLALGNVAAHKADVLACKASVEAANLLFFVSLLAPPGIRDNPTWNAAFDDLRSWAATEFGSAFHDTSAAVADPGNPRHWLPAYSTDDTHYNEAGRDAMAASFRTQHLVFLTDSGFTIPTV